MTETVKSPEDCRTMAQVRDGVDETDRQLVKLLEIRFGYMRAAARIKEERGAVRDDARKAAVIQAATTAASEAGLPAADIGDIWDKLVEASIAYEMDHWDNLRSEAE